MRTEVALGFFSGPGAMLFLQGGFSLLFLSVLARALAARFGGVEMVYAAVSGSYALWAALGCAAVSLSGKLSGRPASPWRRLSLCCAAPALALISCCLAIAAPPVLDLPGQGLPSVGEMLLFCFLAPSLPGLAGGALYGSLCGFYDEGVYVKAYAAESLGAFAAGVAFSSLLAYAVLSLSLLGMLGACLPVLGYVACARGQGGAFLKIGLGVIAATAICAVGFLGGMDKAAAAFKWSKAAPDCVYCGAVDGRSGRYEFLKELKGAASARIMRDGVLEASLPRDIEPDYPAVLMALAQVDRDCLSVLLICPPFSNCPAVLRSLPSVAKLTLAFPDAGPLELSRRFGSIPESSASFRVVEEDPRRFVESTLESYDLIMVMDCDSGTLGGGRLFSQEFLRAVEGRLKKGGAFAASMPCGPGFSQESRLEFEGVLESTMKTAFKKVAVAPGPPALLLGGGDGISMDYDVLDARLSRSMPGAKPFPDGLLGLLCSQAEQSGKSLKVAGAAVSSSASSDLSPSLPFLHFKRHPRGGQTAELSPLAFAQELLAWALFLWKELLAAALAAYAVARYFGSWKMSRKMTFASFENGFFAAGLAVMLLFMLQSRCGSLYRDFAAAAGLLFGGAALGASLAAASPLWLAFAKRCSPAIPALAPLLCLASWDFAYWGVFAALFAGGCSMGSGYWESNGKADSWHSPGFLKAAELLGLSFGAAAFSLFMIPAGGFAVCAAVLALARLPFALSRRPAA